MRSFVLCLIVSVLLHIAGLPLVARLLFEHRAPMATGESRTRVSLRQVERRPEPPPSPRVLEKRPEPVRRPPPPAAKRPEPPPPPKPQPRPRPALPPPTVPLARPADRPKPEAPTVPAAPPVPLAARPDDEPPPPLEPAEEPTPEPGPDASPEPTPSPTPEASATPSGLPQPGKAGPPTHPAIALEPPPKIVVPEEIKRSGSKFVRYELRIMADGKTEVILLTPTGNDEFDREVKRILSNWKWEPAMQDGVPQESKLPAKYDFED